VPGKCDLSAYVNFAALAQFAEANGGIKAFEAIPQGYFLEAMGINPRI
jgi:SAM-dependent MidA family methyltransferase